MKTITLLSDQEFIMSICGGKKKKWHKNKKYNGGGTNLKNFNRSFNTVKLAIVVPIALNFQSNSGIVPAPHTNTSVITQSLALTL